VHPQGARRAESQCKRIAIPKRNAKGQPFEMPVSSRNRSTGEGLPQRHKVDRIGKMGAGSFSKSLVSRYGVCIGLNVLAN
jgi:hypothetical protein